MQQSTQTGRLKLTNIMIMAPLSYLSPHSYKNSVSSKSFSQVETGSAVANEICGENSGSHMYLEVKKFKEKTLEISLKRHLNIIERLWVRQVLVGGKLNKCQ